MTNTDPGAPEYEYDWQNPNKKSFEVGRVVSNTFGVLKSNPVPFFLLTFVGVGIPMTLLSLWPLFLGMADGINVSDPTWADNISWEAIIGPAIAVYLLYIFVIIVIYSAIIQMTMDALNERNVRLGDAIKSGLKFFFPLVGISIIALTGVVVGLMLFIIPGIFVALGWALAYHIKIIEGESIINSLSRAWTLSKGYKRWILLMMIIFAVLGTVISLVFQIPVLFFGNAQTALLEGGSTTFWIANAIGSGLSQMVSVALSYVGLTATYFEIRRVKEGVEFGEIASIFS